MGDIGFCGRCGAPRRPGVAFCNRCGQAYDAPTYAPHAPPPPPTTGSPPQARPPQASPPPATGPARRSTSGTVGWVLLVGGAILTVVALISIVSGGGGEPAPTAPVGMAAGLAFAARSRRGAFLIAVLVLAFGPTALAQEGFACPDTLDGVPLVQETPATENESIPNNFFAACDYQFNNPEGDEGDRAIHMEAFWTTVDPGLSGFGTSGGGGCATQNGTPPVVHQTPEEGITTQQYYFNSLDRYAYVWVLSDRENLDEIEDAASDLLFSVAEPQAALCAAETQQPTNTEERPPPTTEPGGGEPENPELDRATTLEWVMMGFGVGGMIMGGSMVLRDRKRRRSN